MWRIMQGKRGAFIAFLVGAAVASATTASAEALISGKQIKDGTVKMRDLSPAVRSKIQQPGATGATGPAGTTGAPGPAGAQGKTGDTGPAGTFTADNVTVVTGNVATFPTPFPGGAVPQSVARCPSSKVAIGGWFEMQGAFYAEPAPFISTNRGTDYWAITLSWPSTYPEDLDPSYVTKVLCAG